MPTMPSYTATPQTRFYRSGRLCHLRYARHDLRGPLPPPSAASHVAGSGSGAGMAEWAGVGTFS
eukprot:1788621-Pyramimonas_sp.AAC.1